MAKTESGAGITASGSVSVNPYFRVGDATQVVGYGYGTGLWGGETEDLLQSTLNGALLDDTAGTGGSGTSITLASTTGFPTSGTIRVGAELITYTGVSTNDLTGITRAQSGSNRSAHSDGATVTNATSFVGWGEATSTAEVTLEPGNWSLDNFGETLVTFFIIFFAINIFLLGFVKKESPLTV